MNKTIALTAVLGILLPAARSAFSAPPGRPKPAQTQPASAPAIAPASAPSAELLDRISQNYLQDKWDDLARDLKDLPKDLSTLPPARQDEANYIRHAADECRPAWWAQSKAGRKVSIRQVILGKTFNCTFDPNGKVGVQAQFTYTDRTLSVSWPPADMDNPDHAEHGFSKGDLGGLGVWMTLGMASLEATLPQQALMASADKDKKSLGRYFDLRDYLTGIYYGMPRTRRWGLWLALAGYMDKYAKLPTVESRKAIASMLIVEVLSNPGKYPSLKPPASPPGGGSAATSPPSGIEAGLADYFRSRVEKDGWTVAEDKMLREAFKAFAAANDAPVLQSQKVTLPNGLFHMLDTDQDADSSAKREAWIKEQFEKAGK